MTCSCYGLWSGSLDYKAVFEDCPRQDKSLAWEVSEFDLECRGCAWVLYYQNADQVFHGEEAKRLGSFLPFGRLLYQTVVMIFEIFGWIVSLCFQALCLPVH